MIRCNLNILLAERNLKITKVSNDTGISRTTLTSLVNNRAHGIQLDTINSLCSYLKISPDLLISFIPIEINIKLVRLVDDDCMEIDIEIVKNSRTFNCSLIGNYYTSFTDGELSGLDLSIGLWDEEINDEDVKEENRIIISAFNMLSAPFINDIENAIFEEICSKFDFRISDDLTWSLIWDDNFRN